jgi:hypothetical protein
LFAVLFVFFAVFVPRDVYGASVRAPQSVRVSLPSFSVTLNNRRIDNSARRYPLIFYNNITYVPMTWFDCRFLGLETHYKENSGAGELIIESTGVAGGYYEDLAPELNRDRTYTARILDLAVTVNGQAIQNDREPYPLLTFRDVAYFPLTWRFGLEEFGWFYNFEPGIGLEIHSGGGTMDSMTVTLPLARRGDFGGDAGACTVAEEWIYYEGTDGGIYSAPLSDPAAGTLIYQLPLWTYGSGEYVYPSLKTAANGKAYLSYRQGGATMGSNYLARLGPDGVAEELQTEALEFPDLSIRITRSDTGMPVTDNLAVKTRDDADFRTVGDPELVHSDYNAYVAGGFVYTAASPDYGKIEGWPGKVYLYRTDIHTGESVRLCEEPLWNASARYFAVRGDRIIFLNADRRLAEIDLSSGIPRLLPDMANTPVYEFAVSESDIYYIHAETETLSLYRVSDGAALYPGFQCLELSTDGGGYVWAQFHPEDEYCWVIFDPDGRVVYQGGYLDKVLIYQDMLVYVNIV